MKKIILIILLAGLLGAPILSFAGRKGDRKSNRVEIFDRNWQRRGHIKEGPAWSTIHDKDGNRIGYIKDKTIYDKNWNRLLNTEDKK